MTIYTLKCQCGYETPVEIKPKDSFSQALRCPHCLELLEVDRKWIGDSKNFNNFK